MEGEPEEYLDRLLPPLPPSIEHAKAVLTVTGLIDAVVIVLLFFLFFLSLGDWINYLLLFQLLYVRIALPLEAVCSAGLTPHSPSRRQAFSWLAVLSCAFTDSRDYMLGVAVMSIVNLLLNVASFIWRLFLIIGGSNAGVIDWLNWAFVVCLIVLSALEVYFTIVLLRTTRQHTLSLHERVQNYLQSQEKRK